MGRYLLKHEYSLRGWLFNLYSLVDARSHAVRDLSVDEFRALLRCDGVHDIEADDESADLIGAFLDEGVIEPADTATLDPAQAYHLYPCWRFNRVNWAITGRCNYRCRHCFAAADTAPSTAEPTTAQCLRLVDDIAACGIGGIWLTGGEPTLRPDLLDITARIAEHGIRLEDIGTNGSLITDGLLDALEAQGHHPQFNVSFDGIDHHDWLRGVAGAQQRTLAGIRLLLDRGYDVKVQYCLHRGNLDTLHETAEMLSDMGVGQIRIIRVVESVRWMETSPQETLPIREYYSAMLDFIEWYLTRGLSPYLDVWGVFQHMPGTNWCRIVPVHACTDHAERTQAVCGDARQMPFIGSDGSLLLCNQISGYMQAAGIEWGNVFETPLTSLLSDSPFTEQLLCTWGKVRAHNPECMECDWKRLCNCGCRAVALANTGDILGRDATNCVFFKGGCYDDICALARRHGLIAQSPSCHAPSADHHGPAAPPMQQVND